MININSENFDQWMFRYFEGELNEEDQSKLMSYIEKDPALKTDFEAWRDSYVIPEPMTYPKEADLLVGPLNARVVRWAALLLLAISTGAAWWFWPGDTPLSKTDQVTQALLNTKGVPNKEGNDWNGTDKTAEGLPKHESRAVVPVASVNSAVAPSGNPVNVSGRPLGPSTTPGGNNAVEKRKTKKETAHHVGVPVNQGNTAEIITQEGKDTRDNSSDQAFADHDASYSGDVWQDPRSGESDEFDPEDRDPEDHDVGRKPAHLDPEHAQITVFGDPYMVRNTSSLFINPAFAGSERCGRISTNFLLIRPLGMGDFSQYIVGYDRFFPGLHGGLGIELAYDVADQGAVNTSSARIIYSPKFEWRRVYSVEPAISISYASQDIHWSRIDNQQDPALPYLYSREAMSNDPARQGFMSIGTGVVIRHYKWIAGIAMDNLNRPLLPLTENVKMPVRYAAHASYRLYDANGTRLKLVPNMSFEYQAGIGLLTFGCSAEYQHWIIGMGVSNPDRLVSTVGYKSSRYEFGYSYEASFNNIMSTRPTAHEISFRYLLRCRGDNEDSRE